ncbi:DUF99 family protein [Natronomonas sp. EA1]|uniref:endonuclease dU n=1 Tax=Natronomonas sp. EA1 TaxID=3421655 RepID=UPI003EBEE2FB
MKAGVRALGVAESFREGTSTLAGAVVRADRAVDDLAFTTCTVGGLDATSAVERLWTALDRPDVRYLFLSGIAPAWYNLYDLHRLHDATERPVLSVSFEASPGLGDALETEFSGDALDARRAVYDALPDRHPVDVNGETVWVRAVGCSPERVTDLLRGFTPEGGRPEPLRVARLAARAGETFRRDL